MADKTKEVGIVFKKYAIAEQDGLDVRAFVLAGGEGTRLQRLTHKIDGDWRPKQFSKIFGGKSLLTHTREVSGWADLGNPVRVIETLIRNRIVPSWLRKMRDVPRLLEEITVFDHPLARRSSNPAQRTAIAWASEDSSQAKDAK